MPATEHDSAHPPAKRQRKRNPSDVAASAEAAAKVAADAAAAMLKAAADAKRAAMREGLVLVRSHDNPSGYKNVTPRKKSSIFPWTAKVSLHGKKVELGKFATVEEAALSYARHVGAEAAAEMARLYEAKTPITVEAAIAAADAEGLTLREAPGTVSGYHRVSCSRKNDKHTWRYDAHAADLDCVEPGKTIYLGSFDSAEAAALAVARYEAKINSDPQRAAGLGARKTAMKERRCGPQTCSLCGELRKGHVCRMSAAGSAAAVLALTIAPTGVAAEGLLDLAEPNGGTASAPDDLSTPGSRDGAPATDRD